MIRASGGSCLGGWPGDLLFGWLDDWLFGWLGECLGGYLVAWPDGAATGSVPAPRYEGEL